MPRNVPSDPDSDQNRAFPEAQEFHDQILATPDEQPEGWVEQARFRERYGLPPFRPPRFRDGTLLSDNIAALESELGVDIDLVARDVRHDGWVVEIDGHQAFRFDHYRDDAANTIVEMTTDEFVGAVWSAIDEHP